MPQNSILIHGILIPLWAISVILDESLMLTSTLTDVQNVVLLTNTHLTSHIGQPFYQLEISATCVATITITVHYLRIVCAMYFFRNVPVHIVVRAREMDNQLITH